MLPNVFRFLLNSNTEALDLTKGKLFQLCAPLKWKGFFPYTVDFIDDNDRPRLLVRCDKFL